MKNYQETNVREAAEDRIRKMFDAFERVYVSFSGGKDSTVMLHLVMAEAKRRGRRVGVLVIDLEAQYEATMEHIATMLDTYAEWAEVHWVCLPMLLRNAVTQYEPRWCCWDPDARPMWVRELPEHPGVVSDVGAYPFFSPRMEFEEFMVLWGLWYSQGKRTAACVGIRADESLNRYRAVASSEKAMLNGWRWTTQVEGELYNAYPIYDWKTQDIWTYHAKTGLAHNRLYDLMHLAGLTIHQMRICQPYGDDQRRGLWLYHLIEPQTWARVVARVNGANSGALYIEETGNVTGYNKISKPPGHSWESFCNLLLASLPEPTRLHYEAKFRVFLKGWKGRGYVDGIPDEAPRVLEEKHWAPSWRVLQGAPTQRLVVQGARTTATEEQGVPGVRRAEARTTRRKDALMTELLHVLVGCDRCGDGRVGAVREREKGGREMSETHEPGDEHRTVFEALDDLDRYARRGYVYEDDAKMLRERIVRDYESAHSCALAEHRVRERHHATTVPAWNGEEPVCAHCSRKFSPGVPWPCPTLQDIIGEQEKKR